MIFEDCTNAVCVSLAQVWSQVITFVPTLLGAVLVFIVGLIIAGAVGRLVEKLFVMSRIDSVFVKTGIPREFERAGVNFSLARFFGRMIYWFILVVMLLAVANILLGPDSNVLVLLAPVLVAIPNVIAAILILVGTVLLANFLAKLVRASVMGARLHASKILATVTWWVVILTGIVAALQQLNIGEFYTVLIGNAMQAILMGSALAFGLAFGLGGKEYAASLLEKLRNQTENHNK